jgi:hypothetical protein
VFIEGDSVVGIDAKELFDFFDDLLDVDPGLDDSDLVEEVSDEYDLDYEDALEGVSQYNIHLEEESDFDDDEEDEEEDF